MTKKTTEATEPVTVLESKQEGPIVRACGYNPAKDMIPVEYPDHKELYLRVANRVLWFNKWLEDHGKQGFIDDSEYEFVHINPNDPNAPVFIVCKATVYIGGEIVGKSQAGGPLNFSDPGNFYNALKTYGTQAKGRALANAGFGTTGTGAEDGAQLPCDSGIPTVSTPPVSQHAPVPPTPQASAEPPRQAAEVSPPAPPKATEAPPAPAVNKEPMKAKNEAPKPSPAPTAPTLQPGDEDMTLEEALAYKIPIGQHAGESMREFMANDPKLFAMCVSGEMKASKYANVCKAARVIAASQQ